MLSDSHLCDLGGAGPRTVISSPVRWQNLNCLPSSTVHEPRLTYFMQNNLINYKMLQKWVIIIKRILLLSPLLTGHPETPSARSPRVKQPGGAPARRSRTSSSSVLRIPSRRPLLSRASQRPRRTRSAGRRRSSRRPLAWGMGATADRIHKNTGAVGTCAGTHG